MCHAFSDLVASGSLWGAVDLVKEKRVDGKQGLPGARFVGAGAVGVCSLDFQAQAVLKARNRVLDAIGHESRGDRAEL